MQVCISFQSDNHASTSPLSFLQAGCPSCRPTNNVKALKASPAEIYCISFLPAIILSRPGVGTRPAFACRHAMQLLIEINSKDPLNGLYHAAQPYNTSHRIAGGVWPCVCLGLWSCRLWRCLHHCKKVNNVPARTRAEETWFVYVNARHGSTESRLCRECVER